MLLVRHGKTVLNDPNKPKLRGWKDVELSDEGKVQAQLTAQRLRFYRPKEVYSSDFTRDMQTALLISERLNIPYQAPDFDARTWDTGLFSGQPEEDVNERVMEFYKRPWETPPGSSESFNGFSDRWVRYMEGKADWAANGQRPIILVTHGRNIALANAHLSGVNPWDADMPLPAGYAEIRVGNDGSMSMQIMGEREPVLADV